MLAASWTASSAAGSSASASKVQSGELMDLGNVRLVGMSKTDVQGLFKMRVDPTGAGIVYMLPADVITNTIAAFSVSATSATGYSGAVPTGQYFAPANGPDCIEIEGQRRRVRHGQSRRPGPLFQQHDVRVSKRTAVVGHTTFEFAAELLNALNHPNFIPVSGIGNTTLSSFQVTALNGTNTVASHQIVTAVQLVVR